MTVITFEDITPIPRYDGVAWSSASLQESDAADGTWTDIDSFTLTPADADPRNPRARSFTTENATLDQGWYRFIFSDTLGDRQLPTEPIHNIPDETLAFQPTVTEVAQLIMARTKDTLGNELGVFTELTRPTHEQTVEAIAQAADEVTMAIDTDLPEGAYEYVKQAIALKTAMNIERSYFAEQINNNRSPYSQLKEEYDFLMGTTDQPGYIIRSVEREAQELETGEEGLLNRPRYSFPDAELRYRLGRPL